jgi:diguanylate cyclase (GGDEF)-like protein
VRDFTHGAARQAWTVPFVTHAAPRKLLVVDDDPECLRLLRALLENAGYDVILARDGVEAFDRVIGDRPEIILTDWLMPQMDGIELVRKIRAELSWYPYILLVTCKSDQQLGLDIGADDFISKPIRPEALLPRIRAGERIVTLQERLREKNLELNLANQQLAELAITDPLSGLLNRRAFFDESKKEWHRAIRYELPLSCLMIDIDQFKHINDTYGHTVGDHVIRTVGRTLRMRLRDNDVLCRYGGEEFCVLLTNTPLDPAVLLAERLRKLISQLIFPQLPTTFRLTISLGIATRTLHTLSDQALIDEADKALLAAKRTGRNRALRFDDLASLPLGSADPDDLPCRESTSGDWSAVGSGQVINTLLGALAHRDQAAVGHCQRVAHLCEQFGQFLGLEPSERLCLEIAALLHEIGRLAMPDRDLEKTERFNEEDFAVGQQALLLTVELIQSCFGSARIADMVRLASHWYDGSHGALHGSQIPIGARILAIAGFFDDVLNGRGGWDQLSKAEALRALQRHAGTRFDPDLVGRFAVMLQTQHASPPATPILAD